MGAKSEWYLGSMRSLWMPSLVAVFFFLCVFCNTNNPTPPCLLSLYLSLFFFICRGKWFEGAFKYKTLWVCHTNIDQFLFFFILIIGIIISIVLFCSFLDLLKIILQKCFFLKDIYFICRPHSLTYQTHGKVLYQ